MFLLLFLSGSITLDEIEVHSEALDVLLHPSPPLERESCFRIVGFMIQKTPILSIRKMGL
jgi:hypothetical protein